MKKIFSLVCVIAAVLSLSACADSGGGSQTEADITTPESGITTSAEADESSPQTVTDGQPAETDITMSSSGMVTEESDNMLSIEIMTDDKVFVASLYDNETAAAFKEKLPLTLDMSELNGNEKYYYLDFSLPTDQGKPSGINSGDLMLYGDSCLVLFYESFSTSYSYTPIGYIDDPAGLADALGSGGAQITFR